MNKIYLVVKTLKFSLCSLCTLCLRVILFPIIFILFSCQSTPKGSVAGGAEWDGHFPFEPGAIGYMFVDVNNSRLILDNVTIPGMNQKQAKTIIDKTNNFAAAIYRKNSVPWFQLAAWGQFTASQGNMAFGMNRDWKKSRCDSGHTFWHSNDMALALNKGLAFFSVSGTDSPVAPCNHSKGVDLPPEFSKYTKGAAILCWLEKPGNVADRFFEKLELPIKLPAENIIVSFMPMGDKPFTQYEAIMRIQTASATQARSVSRLISFASGRAGGSGGDFSEAGVFEPLLDLFFANPPVTDNEYIIIKTPLINALEMALLINTFLLDTDTENL